ncbi:MAG: tyrosine-type recombinase/integrase, partial [Bacteriovoracaceae bacterium]
DEDEGPYNDQELNSIVRLLKNDIKLSHGKLLAYLFLTLGVNPRNLVLLKWEHFSVIENGSHKIYLLKVPRIKKRSETIDFKLRELDQRVGIIFDNLKSKADDGYVFKDSNGEPLTVMGLRGVLLNYLSNLFEGSELENVRISPRRFRYTFATRLVISGVSKERLADLLDHTDLQHVQIYYDLRHKIKGFLTEAENKKLGTILKRFEGSIEFANTDIGKDIKYYTLTANSALGKCGSDAHCDLNAPYSCFVCPKFNAFSDSLESYKKVYDDLLSWKKNRKEEFDENDRIQYQMDEVISALTDLIARIEEKI